MEYEGILISANGIQYNRYKNEDRRMFIEPCDNPMFYLKSYCEIAKGTTLLQLMDAVDQYPELKQFIAMYSGCPDIEEFHAQIREPMRSDDPVEYLEVRWKARLRHGEFDIYSDFYGFGKETEEMKSHDGSGLIRYSVSYTPLYEMADCPIVLNSNFSVRDDKGKVIIQGNKRFDFLEVLDAIYDDISFMGGPEDNAQFLEDMRERVKEYKEGKEELIPLDDMLKRIKDEEDRENKEWFDFLSEDTGKEPESKK